jgi:anaerobic nitric oxide reductase transcription regulator
VGSNLELSFTGRIVAATHRDLKALSSAEKFREDLYYRLSVVAVELPPLRGRGSDLLILAESLCRKHGLQGIEPERVAEMRSYSWPGNIRELNNWIERASILGLHDDQGYLNASLPATTASPGSSPQALAQESTQSLAVRSTKSRPGGEARTIKELRAEVLDSYDRRWIAEALERHNGNISAAAKDLGLDRKNLAKRMKDLSLDSGNSKKAA